MTKNITLAVLGWENHHVKEVNILYDTSGNESMTLSPRIFETFAGSKVLHDIMDKNPSSIIKD